MKVSRQILNNLNKFQKLEKENRKEKSFQQYKICKDKTLKDVHTMILQLLDKKLKSKNLY